MALIASQCRNSVFLSRLLPRTSLVLSHRILERSIAVRSEKFPEYSLIYDFEKIRAAARFNRFKYYVSILTGVSSSTLFFMQNLTSAVSPHGVISFTFVGGMITIFLHACGHLFNSVIGYIYLKDDGETVKISYLDYWGRRIDFDTKLSNIQMFSDNEMRFSNPWYKRVRFNDTKKSFKLYHTAGQILDDKVFGTIFGDVQ